MGYLPLLLRSLSQFNSMFKSDDDDDTDIDKDNNDAAEVDDKVLDNAALDNAGLGNTGLDNACGKASFRRSRAR